jgi:hypothetical protein
MLFLLAAVVIHQHRWVTSSHDRPVHAEPDIRSVR